MMDAVRSKKIKAPMRYLCVVCKRMSQFPSPCSNTCRIKATPEQLKPALGSAGLNWHAKP